MSQALSLIVAIPPAMLLAVGMIPSRLANRHEIAMCRVALTLLCVSFWGSVSAAAAVAYQGALDATFLSWTWPIPANLGIYFDNLAAVMAVLISFVGFIIARFSVRYLQGEPARGRFFRWMMFTLGAVLVLVISRNLVMFTAAWMLTSFGLHQLLTHYSDRPWAIWAARKKFLISRLGDALLIGALILTYQCFGSFDYQEVFKGAQSLGQDASPRGWLVSLIGTLFVLGAMTKSAQIPFHSWLPDTMETPTPVSALMHAGVINAGGFLIIRLSPIVSQSHLALDVLALIGAMTALFGGVVMLTQTSVKRSLAYSTIAQMGFMMLQCGLGAFSAALLHIVAHSLYKAHAFLSSGSVIDAAARIKTSSKMAPSIKRSMIVLPLALATSSIIVGGIIWASGVNVAIKPGAGVLGIILLLAVTHLIYQSFQSGSSTLAGLGIVGAGVVGSLYFVAWLMMDRILASTVSYQSVPPSILDFIVFGVVAMGFMAIFYLQVAAQSHIHHRFLQSLYVHADNGFYMDVPARRLTAIIWGNSSPTP